MAEWGNGRDVQAEVDMQSPAGNYNLEVTNINAARSALKTTNSHANGLALEVAGKTYLGGLTTVEDNLTCNAECHVTETLFADAEANVAGHLNCEDDVDIDGQLQVGPDNAAGAIDSGGGQNPQELRIGTNNVTADVEIGRDGRRTIVRSDVLKVGQADDAGVIESGGTQVAPQNLKIGTLVETLNIHISRPGQTVMINDTIRIQLDAALNATIILNGDEAATINDPLARGIADNPVGHGFGPSMDHLINGVPRFCVDQTGGPNV